MAEVYKIEHKSSLSLNVASVLDTRLCQACHSISQSVYPGIVASANASLSGFTPTATPD